MADTHRRDVSEPWLRRLRERFGCAFKTGLRFRCIGSSNNLSERAVWIVFAAGAGVYRARHQQPGLIRRRTVDEKFDTRSWRYDKVRLPVDGVLQGADVCADGDAIHCDESELLRLVAVEDFDV